MRDRTFHLLGSFKECQELLELMIYLCNELNIVQNLLQKNNLYVLLCMRKNKNSSGCLGCFWGICHQWYFSNRQEYFGENQESKSSFWGTICTNYLYVYYIQHIQHVAVDIIMSDNVSVCIWPIIHMLEMLLTKQFLYTKMTLDASCTSCFYSFNFTYRCDFHGYF